MKRRHLIFFPSAIILTLGSCSFPNPLTPQKELYIASYPDTQLYNVGGIFSLEGLRVIDIDSGQDVLDYRSSIPEGYQFVQSDVSASTKVTISKDKYKSTSFNIAVRNIPTLEITRLPKQIYQIGEYFSLDGLVVTAEGVEIADYTCNFSTANRLNTSGTFDVIISKENYWPATYQIVVNPVHALFVTSLPSKTTYEVGEYYSSQGLVVKDELDNVVTDYTSSLEEGSQFKFQGTVTVTLSKEGYDAASFDLTVNPKSSGGDVTYRNITIYYLNDTHGSFIRNPDLDEAGMSYISKYIKTKVSNDPSNSIVLSGGDMFQGGYESNETHGKIMIESMNEIGFDAMVLGNHEFDWGESYIETFAETLDCPIISANTFYSYDRVTRPDWLSPYTVITRGDLKIGIIGGDRQNLGSSITGSISDNFYFPSPNEYIKSYSTYLRANEGCDIIIAAFHDEGFEGYDGSPTKYSDLTEIDSETNCKYVDAMFFAHDHLRKTGTFNGVPYLEAGCNGKNIGELTLKLENNGVVYTVDSSTPKVIWACSNATTPDSAIEAIAAKAEYADIIAHADDVIYTFSNSYSEENFTYVVCMAMYWYVNAHKNEFDNTTIYFASHNTGGVRSEVNAGQFTRRDLVKVFPFDNQLSLQTCTAQNIYNMERSSYYRTYKESEPVYDDHGFTKAISITYITEYKYAYNYQVSYINYNATAKDALLAYLLNNINPNL